MLSDSLSYFGTITFTVKKVDEQSVQVSFLISQTFESSVTVDSAFEKIGVIENSNYVNSGKTLLQIEFVRGH